MYIPLYHLDELYIEDECRIRRNAAAGTALSVCQTVGNEEAVFCPFAHELYALCPSGDDAVEGECGALSALVGGVEDGAVDESAFVVAFHAVGGFGLAQCTLAQDGILQSAGQDHDAVFLGVFGQEGFAGFAYGLALVFLAFLPFLNHVTKLQ